MVEPQPEKRAGAENRHASRSRIALVLVPLTLVGALILLRPGVMPVGEEASSRSSPGAARTPRAPDRADSGRPSPASSAREPLAAEDLWTPLRGALLDAVSARRKEAVDRILDEVARFARKEGRIPLLVRAIDEDESVELREALHFALVRAAPEVMRTAFLSRFSDGRVDPRMRIAALVAAVHVEGTAENGFVYAYPFLDVRIPDPPAAAIMEIALAIVRSDDTSFATLREASMFMRGLVPLVESWIRADGAAFTAWLEVALTPPTADSITARRHLLAAFRAHPSCAVAFQKAIESDVMLVRAAALSVIDEENYPAMVDGLQKVYREDPYPGLREIAFGALVHLRQFSDAEVERFMREAELNNAIAAFKGLVDWGGDSRRAAYDYAFSGEAPARMVLNAIARLEKLERAPFDPDEARMRRFLFDHRDRFCPGSSKLDLVAAARRFGWWHLRPLLAEVAADEAAPVQLRRAAERALAEW